MRDNTSVKERLISYLAYKGITKADFGRSIGVSVAYVTSISVSIPQKKILKIKEIYKDLNIDWLLYGFGEMLNAPTGYNQESEPKMAMLGEQMTDYGERLKENNTEMQRQLRELLQETIRQGQRIDRILTLMEREKEQNGTE